MLEGIGIEVLNKNNYQCDEGVRYLIGIRKWTMWTVNVDP